MENYCFTLENAKIRKILHPPMKKSIWQYLRPCLGVPPPVLRHTPARVRTYPVSEVADCSRRVNTIKQDGV